MENLQRPLSACLMEKHCSQTESAFMYSTHASSSNKFSKLVCLCGAQMAERATNVPRAKGVVSEIEHPAKFSIV